MQKNKTISVAAWLGLNSLTSKILWACTLILIMRSLGPQGFAYLSVGWAYFGLIAAVTDLGAAQVLLRASSRDINTLKSYLKKVLFLKVALTIVSLLFASAILFISDKGELSLKSKILLLAGGAILFDHFQTIFAYVSQVTYRLGTFTVLRIVQSILLLIIIFMVIESNGRELEVSVVHFCLTLVFMLVGSYIFLTIQEVSILREIPVSLKKVIKESVPFLGSSLLNFAYYRVDVILLSYIATQKLTGIYSGQYQLILTLFSIPSILISAILPGLYQLNKEKLGIRHNLNVACKYMNVLSMLFFPIIFFYAEEIMTVAGGEKFSDEYQGLQILSLLILMFMFTVVLNALIAIDKIRYRLICEASALIIILCLGPFAIKYFSITGMAVVAVISYLISGLLGLRYLVIFGYIDTFQIFINFIKISLATIPGVIFLAYSNFPIVVNCFIYIPFILFGCLIFKVWDLSDKERFKYIITSVYNYGAK